MNERKVGADIINRIVDNIKADLEELSSDLGNQGKTSHRIIGYASFSRQILLDQSTIMVLK
jgi:hypothetical protein